MRREVHPALIHHALGEVSGIGRIVGGENAEELIPAGEEVVVVADVGEELEGRRRGGGRGEGRGPGRPEPGPGLLPAGVPPDGGPPAPDLLRNRGAPSAAAGGPGVTR